MIGKKVPQVTFRTRVRDESIGGDNPFRWEDKTSADYFNSKKVVLFSLPALSRRPARPISYLILKSCILNSRPRVWMQSTVCP